MLIAACHTEASGWTEVRDLDRLSDLRAEAGNLLWAEADLASLNDDDVALIAEEFGLHPLAVEDAQHPWQRPKVDFYDDHAFVVVHQLDEIDEQVEAAQIACFIGERYVLTIHAGAQRILDEAKTRWDEASKQQKGPGFLMHALLDALVDDYQTLADRLENEIEQLEEIALETPDVPIQRQLYSVKQRTARLRRYALPASRVLQSFADPSREEMYAPETEHLFTDVHDHLLRMGEQIRNVDELTQAVLDLTRAEQAQRLNDSTKRLTGWAAIIAVPTFIASVYGMNFALVPEEGSLGGFFFALSIMIVAGAFLYVYFKRRRWI